MNSLVLCIETGTDVCSVGLARDGELVALRESTQRDHAAKIAIYTQEVLAEAGVKASDLSAVAVGKGPGSYTGLRIGVSLAKGLCYGLNIPLIAVGSLESLVQVAIEKNNFQFSIFNFQFIPMIDARRMEVYAQVFDEKGVAQTDPKAVVVDENSFSEYRDSKVFIFGNGADKCRETLPWAHFLDVAPSARGMVRLATDAFGLGNFENVAYFEPFYLKDFVITTSKNKLL